MQAGHLRGKAGFIDEDKPRRIKVKLAVEPVLTAFHKVGSLLLQSMCGLFLNVQPCLRSQTSRALRPIETDFSSRRRVTISFSVTSLDASIMPTIKASCTSKRDPSRRPCLEAVSWPSRPLAIQAIAVEIPIPNRAAADRADIPSLAAARNATAKIVTQCSCHHHLLIRRQGITTTELYRRRPIELLGPFSPVAPTGGSGIGDHSHIMMTSRRLHGAPSIPA